MRACWGVFRLDSSRSHTRPLAKPLGRPAGFALKTFRGADTLASGTIKLAKALGQTGSPLSKQHSEFFPNSFQPIPSQNALDAAAVVAAAAAAEAAVAAVVLVTGEALAQLPRRCARAAAASPAR